MISVTRSKARGGEGSPSPMLWNSPLQAARSGEVLAVADLASSTCAPEPSLSASHAREAAEYAEEMERRELAKQQASSNATTASLREEVVWPSLSCVSVSCRVRRSRAVCRVRRSRAVRTLNIRSDIHGGV